MPVFLMTDIEGSTEKWLSHGDAMGEALSRHDAVLEEVLAGFRGKLVKHTGDGVFAVFEETANPMDCALELRRRLRLENWDDVEGLRVRMALHSGKAQQRRGDYFGAAVSETARIMEMSWGGQILVSAAAREADSDSERAAFLSMGCHTLRGFPVPMEIFQLEDMEAEETAFPPLRSTRRKMGNLPSMATPFVGRTRELLRLRKTLLNENCRILTLLGPGGAGKTRMAVKAAEDLQKEFRDGAWFVSLAPVESPDSIVTAIATALRLSFYSHGDPTDQLIDYLKDRELFLILDNFEHLANEAGIAALISREAPKVLIMVTSRTRLNLRSEWIFDLKGMAEDDSGEGLPAALQLFQACARRSSGDFTVSEENITYVRKICRLVEGLPLGIEIAASWIRSLDPGSIADRIGEGFSFLSTGLRDLPERHRSLERVFQYSWQLLKPQLQRVLCRLSVFRGGFTGSAAAEVAGASLLHLSGLMDHSLLQRLEGGPGGSVRYDMHEAVRQFAADRFRRAEGEAVEKSRRKHAMYFAGMLRHLKPELDGMSGSAAHGKIGSELDNILAGWNYSVNSANLDCLNTMTDVIYSFYTVRGWFSELSRLFDLALSTLDGPAAESAAAGKLQLYSGWIAVLAGRTGEGKKLLSRSLDTFEKLKDHAMASFALNRLGSLTLFSGDFSASLEMQKKALMYAGDDPDAGARVHLSLGNIRRKAGEYHRARGHYQKSLSLYRGLNRLSGQALALGNLGIVAYRTGDLDGALELNRQSLELARMTENRRMVAEGVCDIANVLRNMGRYDEAEEAYEESLRVNRELGLGSAVTITLENMASLAMLQGRLDRAGELLEEALDIALGLGRRVMVLELYTRSGQLALKKGNVSEAAELFIRALNTAEGLSPTPTLVHTIFTLTEFLAEAKEGKFHLPAAVYLLESPITTSGIRKRTRELLRREGIDPETMPATEHPELQPLIRDIRALLKPLV